MRAEDILPDAASHAEFDGLAVRKGTVAAFLANARAWCDAEAAAPARAAAEARMRESLPALRALGLFEVLQVRDGRLLAWIAEAEAGGA